MVGQGFAEGGEDVAELALADVAVPFLVKHLEARDKVVCGGCLVSFVKKDERERERGD